MSGTVQITRTQAEIDALDGLVALTQPPILSHVIGFDPFDQTPILDPNAPDYCENVL